MTEQLILDLKLSDTATFENFYVGQNSEAVEFLKNTFLERKESYVYIWGPEGIGKSHLLHASCRQMVDNNLRAFYLDLAELEQLSPEVLQGLEQYDLVCFDNFHKVCESDKWQESFFYFYNRFRDKGHRLLIAANQAPKQLPMSLADLKSRLSWGLVLALQEGTDLDKSNILQLQAKTRGMILTDDVCQYIFNHYSRDIPRLMQLLNKIDKHSLMEKRKVTIPFLKTLF